MESTSTDPELSDRLKAIVGTEKHIDDMMRCAREVINDLGKEKQISKNKMEDNANTFKKLITQVENELSSQMQYLSHVCVGSSHQGSTFGTLQNSLLAQAGCASLHAELADILAGITPPPPTPEATTTTTATESESTTTSGRRTAPGDVQMATPSEEEASEATGASSGGPSSGPPRSQEEPEMMEE